MSVVSKAIAAVEFQANSKQASAAIDSIRVEADKCNKKVAELQKRLKEGVKTITIEGKATDVEKEIKNQQKLARSYTDAANALVKGANAWSELWGKYKSGSIEDLTGQQIKAGVNAGKRMYDRLLLGDKEDRRQALAIKTVLDQANIVLDKLQSQAQKVIDTIADGGRVSDEVLQREKKYLQDMMDLSEKFGPEWQEYNRQLQAINDGIEKQVAAEKRLRGELVDVNDARKEAEKLDADVAKAAKDRFDEQQKIIDAAKEQTKVLNEQRRAHQDTANQLYETIAQQEREIKGQENVIDSIKTENKARKESAKNLKSEADGLDKRAAKQERLYNTSVKNIDKYKEKISTLTGNINTLIEQQAKLGAGVEFDKQRETLATKIATAQRKQAKAESDLATEEKNRDSYLANRQRFAEQAEQKRNEANKLQDESIQNLTIAEMELNQMGGKRIENVKLLQEENKAIAQITTATNEQATIINNAQVKQAKNRQLSIDSIEKSIELLRQQNRVIGDETNPEWVENEKLIGKLNQRLTEMKQHAMELQRMAVTPKQYKNISDILGGDLGKQSEANIRQAIANAKELVQVYGTSSKEAQTLSAQIVNAEEYLKTVGVEAARSAQQQAKAEQELADKHKLMQQRMGELSIMSRSALAESQKYWQAQFDGAMKGSDAYKEAERNLKALTERQKALNGEQLRASARRLNTSNLSTLSEQEIQASIAAAKQLVQSLKPTDYQYQTLIDNIVRAEEHLKEFGLEGQRSAKQVADQLQRMTDRMGNLGALSDSALAETRKFWEEQMAGADRGSDAYQKAEANLDKIVKKQQELAIAQNKVSADNLLTASTSKKGFSGMSENELRNGINAAREYQKSLAADSNEYKNLSIAIAKADEYIKLYGVDAEKAKMKEAELKASMRDRVSTLQKLQQASTSGLAEAQKYWQAQMDGAERGTKEFQEAEAALQKVNEQMSVRANAQSQRVLGTPDKYGDAEVKEAVKAMEQLRDAQAHGSVEWDKYNSLVERGRKYLEDWANTDAVDKYEQKMQNLATISDAALADMRKFWETTIANTEQGSTDLQKYEDYLKKVVAVENDRRDSKNLGEVDLLKSNDLSKFSESEIRRAIEAGKQLIQTYETGSQDAKDLAKNIVNAEKHLEQYGISAEKSAQREAEALKKANDERAQHDQLMQDQLKQGTSLSESALKAQESYWQRLIDDPKTASSSLQQYQANLLKVDMIQKQMVADNGNNALKFFQGDTSDASADEIKQQADALKKWRDTLPAQTEASTIQQINDILAQLGENAKGAADKLMSLRDAYKIGLQGLSGSFSGTNEQLKQAKKTLEDTLETTDIGTKRYGQLSRALDGIALEEQRVGSITKEIQAVLDKPKGRSFNELKLAVEEGRKSLNDMDRTTRQGQQSFDELAKKVKAADLEMRNLQGESKGVKSSFEKAWDRFKTYATFYVGTANALQKIGDTVDDLMQLSDKMGEVRKTTGFTADQVGRLSDNLSKLDTRTSLTQLMDLSAAAGQLGLTTQDDIQGFTQAANEMLVALPEMGTEGATEMMKIAIATGEVNKIQKQMQDGTVQGSSATAVAMEKIGSTIDRLRASTAAAAPPIADFVKRVGAVGAQSGISVDQVAALGATVDSLGMGTEMAATALARMIPAIKNNAFDVAKAIGVNPDTLRDLFAAGKGMEAVLLVLQKMHDQDMGPDSIEKFLGENGMTGIMKDLDQRGARAGIVFAGLSQNVDVLRQNLATANEAYEQGTAIMDEYSKMNDTLAGKWERLKNQVEEFFVSNDTQNFLGGIVNALRWIVDLLTGDSGISAALRTVFMLVAVGRLKIASLVADAIGPITTGIKGIIGAIKGVKTALTAVQWGNFALAALSAIAYIIYELATLKSATEVANESLGKANAEIQSATARFENYWQTIAQTNKTLQQAQRQHAILSAEVDRMRNSTDRSSTATANLSAKEAELKKSEDSVKKASVSRREAIHAMNSIYGKYLGFILNETNYSYMAAKAHDQVTAAIKRETLAKQREAAITEIGSKYNDKTISDYGDLVTNLIEQGKLTRQQAVHAANHIQSFFDNKVKYNSKTGQLEWDRKEWARLQKSGINPRNFTNQQLIAISAGDYLRGNYHLNENQIANITGMWRDVQVGKGGRRVQTVQTKTTGFSSNIRANYADTFVNRRNEEGKVDQVYGAASADADSEFEKDSRSTVKAGLNVARAQVKILHNPKATKKQKAAANKELGNQIENMSNNIDNANDNSLRKQVDDFATSLKKDKYVNLGAVSKAQQEAHKSLSDKLLNNYGDNSGNTRVGGGTSSTTDKPLIPQTSDENNPFGTPQSAASTNWSKMSADALVDRRKQMNNFVKAIQSDSDISSVLKEDPALQNAIKKGLSKDMDSVIGWYNKQRLAIQDELHKRFLKNTGNWKDPTVAKKRAKSLTKELKDEMSYYIDSVDAYYTKQKSDIEEAQNNGEISEAEGWRRTLQNDQQWHQRRAELQQIYAKQGEKVTKDEQEAIYNIISKITGESVDEIKANMQSTLDFETKIGEKSPAILHAIFGNLYKVIEKDFLKVQNAVQTQVKAITDIINKERPFNGIVENLQNNLEKMGLLQADLEKRRQDLLDKGVKEDDSAWLQVNDQFQNEVPKRLTFLLEEAEDAYSTTWDKLSEDMRSHGFAEWAEYITHDPNSEDMERGIIAELHSVYDDVQEAIKKESSLVKKTVENYWNDATQLPDGTSIKQTYEKAINALGLEADSTSRANSMINAGAASGRVADKLAIKQMQIQLAMQQHYYNLLRKTGQQRVDDLKRAEAAQRKLGDAELDENKKQEHYQEAERLHLDAKHAQLSLNLTTSEEETELAKQRQDITAREQESYSHLYNSMKEWNSLVTSSVQSIFEASNTGAGEYYNNLAKMRLTGEGAGGGTYVVIDDAGTKDATAHYETMDGEQALKRQLDIDQHNATVDAFKKVMDDINKKMNDQITDWINAMFQTNAIDNNTRALVENTAALKSMGLGATMKAPDLKISRNADGMAVDAKGNILYPMQPTKAESKKPRWQMSKSEEAEADNDISKIWSGYKYGMGNQQTDDYPRNQYGAATDYMGNIIAPIQPVDIPQTDDGTSSFKPFWQMTSEELEAGKENINELWNYYKDTGITANQELKESTASGDGSTDNTFGDGFYAPQYGVQDADGTFILPDTVVTAHQQAAEQVKAIDADKTEALLKNQTKIGQAQKANDKKMTDSSKHMYGAMIAAANLYGAAYQAMTNDNLSSSQKFQMIALQAAGQTTMALMTASFVDSETNTLTSLPEILAKCLKISPLAGAAIFAALSALIGASLGVAMSKLSKGKSQVAQVTGASSSAGRLTTGMLTYAEGNVNEFTDPDTLTPGKSYNVDAADGRTYRAKYTGKNPTTHITNGPEFHLAGERGKEAIIDAHTTRLLQMDDTGIWKSIQTLYNGGSLQSVRRSTKGMRAFATGNLDDFDDALAESGVGEDAVNGTTLTPDAAAAMQQSLDRNNELLQRALDEGIHAKFDVYGKGGLIDSYDTGKKTVNRHGERY